MRELKQGWCRSGLRAGLGWVKLQVCPGCGFGIFFTSLLIKAPSQVTFVVVTAVFLSKKCHSLPQKVSAAVTALGSTAMRTRG